ncbi:MAG: PilZ domain-containing protein [Gammaproteobacteria bacterium]|nr:MAG: PilZ domain-containing protein [Gammaproteobacteria bacterium]
MNEERRREPRLDALPLNLFAYDNLSNKLLGTLVNLSSRGLMILGSGHGEPGGVMQIDLRSADAPDKPLLSLGLKVSWVSPANTAGSYWMGGRIIGLEPEHAKTLAELLQQLRQHADSA